MKLGLGQKRIGDRVALSGKRMTMWHRNVSLSNDYVYPVTEPSHTPWDHIWMGVIVPWTRRGSGLAPDINFHNDNGCDTTAALEWIASSLIGP